MKLSVHLLLSAVGLGSPLSAKYGFDSRAPQKSRMIGKSDHSVLTIDLQAHSHSHTVLYTAVWNVYVVCTTDDVQ